MKGKTLKTKILKKRDIKLQIKWFTQLILWTHFLDPSSDQQAIPDLYATHFHFEGPR